MQLLLFYLSGTHTRQRAPSLLRGKLIVTRVENKSDPNWITLYMPHQINKSRFNFYSQHFLCVLSCQLLTSNHYEPIKSSNKHHLIIGPDAAASWALHSPNVHSMNPKCSGTKNCIKRQWSWSTILQPAWHKWKSCVHIYDCLHYKLICTEMWQEVKMVYIPWGKTFSCHLHKWSNIIIEEWRQMSKTGQFAKPE